MIDSGLYNLFRFIVGENLNIQFDFCSKLVKICVIKRKSGICRFSKVEG